MPVLKSLSFTALPKTGNDPILMCRAKFVAKLEEQKLLLKDPNFCRSVASALCARERMPTIVCSREVPKADTRGNAGTQKGSVTVGAARRSSYLRGGGKGATIVLWKAAICHAPPSLTKTRRLSS
jgi:hypothetical protein